MTEVTQEARKELDAMCVAVFAATGWHLDRACHLPIMLALDRHHGRTPPDPFQRLKDRLVTTLRNLEQDKTVNGGGYFNPYIAQTQEALQLLDQLHEARLAEVEAERDGLRAALEIVAAPCFVSIDDLPDYDQPNGWRDLAVARVDAARAALGAKP